MSSADHETLFFRRYELYQRAKHRGEHTADPALMALTEIHHISRLPRQAKKKAKMICHHLQPLAGWPVMPLRNAVNGHRPRFGYRGTVAEAKTRLAAFNLHVISHSQTAKHRQIKCCKTVVNGHFA